MGKNKESKEIMDAYLTYAVGEKGHLVHVVVPAQNAAQS